MKRRSSVWLYVGIAAIVIALGSSVVACGGSDSNGPEQTVQKVLDAMQNQDIDALWAVIDPQVFDEYTSMGITEESLKAMLAAELFTGSSSIAFSDVVMESQISDDGQTATVKIISGTLTMTEDGETSVNDVKDSDEPAVFNVVLRDGTWYWDLSAFFAATEDTAADETVTTASSGATETSELSDDGEWTTVTVLASTDSPWEGFEGFLVSEPFTVSGDARIVLDMVDTGELGEGVLAWIIPVDLVPAADNIMGWADAVQDETAVSAAMLAAYPTQDFSGLNGTYVILAEPSEDEAAWSMELQIR